MVVKYNTISIYFIVSKEYYTKIHPAILYKHTKLSTYIFQFLYNIRTFQPLKFQLFKTEAFLNQFPTDILSCSQDGSHPESPARDALPKAERGARASI